MSDRKSERANAQARRTAKKVARKQAQEARAHDRRRERGVAMAKRIGIVAGALVVLAGILFAAVRSTGGGVTIAGNLQAHTLDAFTLPALQGSDRLSYASYRDKPLVVNFFASWCPYCIGEMPGFEQVHKQLAAKGVQFLGVSQGDARDASRKLAGETGITYPTAFDSEGALYRWFGGLSMPVTVFIAPGGQIKEVHTGALDPAGLQERITRNFGPEYKA